MNSYCIITTVNHPSKAIEKLYEHFGENLIIVGDVKTPDDWSYKKAKYILDLPNDKGYYSGYAPSNSYARKNLGYIEAIKNKATCIYESDDDSIPNKNFLIRFNKVQANISERSKWFNIYKVFGGYGMWPRGFSLKHIYDEPYISGEKLLSSSIQQGMVDNDPDVDAIWRLTLQTIPVKFDDIISVYLRPYTWCSFNSQSTWFFKNAFPLLYLPVNCTMRCTDIWRSFVAQRCLWEIGEGVTFHSPSEVYQDRNEHDLLKDFEDEIPGYLHNDEIVQILLSLKLKEGQENMCENMVTCYQALCDKNIFPENEIRSLKAWIKDYEQFA